MSSEEVAAPAEEHILEMNNEHGIRVPMSVSERFEDFDNKGNICQVYDCIFNPFVLQKTENDPSLLRFIVELIAARIKERFKQSIKVDGCIKMRNMLYKGKI